MLVLTRKLGEQIVVHVDGVTVQVILLECRDGKAKLGFAAPPEAEIYRLEVCPPSLLPKKKA